MNLFELQIQAYLTKALAEPQPPNEELLESFGDACKAAFKKQFFDGREEGFRLRMSNIGRPTCVLQNEKEGIKGDPLGYNHIMRMLIGDLAEAALLVIIQLAGIKIEQPTSKVCADIAGHSIAGTPDFIASFPDGKEVYDVKTASPYAFNNKFVNAETVVKDDPFGYAAQGFGYARALNMRFGGWVVLEKSTGEIRVVETPRDVKAYSAMEELTFNAVESSLGVVFSDAPVQKKDPMPETWYGKETGNTVLNKSCVLCQFRSTCWPNATYCKNPKSKSSTDWRWYTEMIDET